MINWLKRKLGIETIFNKIASLEAAVSILKQRTEGLLAEINAMQTTDVDVDVGRGCSTIILTGMYKGKGYIRFYDVSEGEFGYLVNRMKDMHKAGHIRNIDKPPMFNGWFDIQQE